MPIRSEILFVAAIAFLVSLGADAQEKAKKKSREYPPQLPGAKFEVYKTIGDVKLNMYVYLPADHKPTDKRPAIVFFFGGGWQSGTPQQFEKHCEYLASRGMVAMTADYRVGSRHGAKVVDCVRDAKSAIRWARKESQRLGIDPNRLAAGGGSAGGHLAAACGVIKGLEEASEGTSISSVPNALVLFNPVLVLVSIDGSAKVDEKKFSDWQKRMGVPPKEVSPYHHVTANAPPTIIFHGQADSTVPFRTVEAFTKAMQNAGNRCELVGYPDQQHGFFNYGRGDDKFFRQTTRKMDEFLTSLGYLSGSPTLGK
ncbi:MAG: alpha/beta hydrolase [Nitrospiraceae bacterium]|nr:MAG: alpha/beta hydrolase [Nitrospiraceae bacterium]